MSSQAKTSDTLTIDFADNRLLTELFGEHDRNLARIEKALDVSLTPSGNHLSIRGETFARERAQSVLQALYNRLEGGHEVSMGEVEGAIRMSDAQTPETDKQASVRTRKRFISPRSATQQVYINALRESELVFGIGPAGTGKTYLAVAMGVAMFLEGQVDRLILSRPAVEAGERLGFLPGDMRDKVDPYLRPLYDALYDMLPAPQVVKSLETGEIEIAPLAFMRGRTLSNAFIILDEAQNSTPVQMKMFLTRLGENSRMAVTGDPSQVDLPLGARSGLAEAQDVLRDVQGVNVVRFTDADVVRHPLVTRIVRAYNANEKSSGSLNLSKRASGNDTDTPSGQAVTKRED